MTGGPPVPGDDPTRPWDAGPAGWGPPTGGWAPTAPPPWPMGAQPARTRGAHLALAALGGALAGAVLTAVAGGLFVLAGATAWSTEEGISTWSSEPEPDPYPYPSGPVEESPPQVPGVLGPDPVLDAYAQSCFQGALQACDDLYYYSSPLSAYEEYGGSCGGRVEAGAVPACTELD